MNRTVPVLQITILVLLALSCSQRPNTPILPNASGASSIPVSTSHSPQLWGFWDVAWNPDANAFQATPLRSAMFAVNVIKFINMNDSNLIINVNSIVPDVLWTDFDLDVGITHPFPGLEAFAGFDVMGVFMGNGSAQYQGSDGFPVAGSIDQKMLNPDGFTRRFNATEFSGAGQIMPLQGYIPGSKGNPGYVPTAVLNPYKYYADGLDADAKAFDFLVNNPKNRGCFRPGSANFRNFKIRMPNQAKKFQYAVLANWEPNLNNPEPPDSLDDFPPEANSQEAVAIKVVDLSDAWFVSPTIYGGDIILDITPWDWSASCSGVMEEYSIKLYSPAWAGPFTVDMTPMVEAEHHCTFNASISASELIDNGDQPVWIQIDYPAYNYTSPVGVPNEATGQLAAYFTTEVNVLDHDPSVTCDNFVYGFADSTIFEFANEADNPKLFENMLNLPLNGPYAENKKVMYYQGHTGGYDEYYNFSEVITNLGYESVYVPASPFVPVDTTGVKMLILSTFFSNHNDLFSPEEIQAIKDLINGGGICIVCIDYADCYNGGTETVEQLISELKMDLSCPMDGNYDTYNCFPYTDFTPDPIFENVDEISGKDSGRFEVFGEGVSLMRGTNDEGFVYNAICKSSWKG